MHQIAPNGWQSSPIQWYANCMWWFLTLCLNKKHFFVFDYKTLELQSITKILKMMVWCVHFFLTFQNFLLSTLCWFDLLQWFLQHAHQRLYSFPSENIKFAEINNQYIKSSDSLNPISARQLENTHTHKKKKRVHMFTKYIFFFLF